MVVKWDRTVCSPWNWVPKKISPSASAEVHILVRLWCWRKEADSQCCGWGSIATTLKIVLAFKTCRWHFFLLRFGVGFRTKTCFGDLGKGLFLFNVCESIAFPFNMSFLEHSQLKYTCIYWLIQWDWKEPSRFPLQHWGAPSENTKTTKKLN